MPVHFVGERSPNDAWNSVGVSGAEQNKLLEDLPGKLNHLGECKS